jgi:anti-sigma B factor antagonist
VTGISPRMPCFLSFFASYVKLLLATCLVEDEGPRRLLLDLSNVRFLSSNALGILVSLKKKVDAAGGRLRLCGLEPDLLELLRITNLDRIFEMYESREEALKDF